MLGKERDVNRGVEGMNRGEHLVFPKSNMTGHTKTIGSGISTSIPFVLNAISKEAAYMGTRF